MNDNDKQAKPVSTISCFDKDDTEVLRIEQDGDVIWKGRKVESDAEFKAAMIDLANFMKSNMRPAQPVQPVEPVAVDHSGLIKRIDAAIERVTQGRGLMSIPADPRSDVDLVLSECKALLQGENPPFWATDFHPAQPVQPVERVTCSFPERDKTKPAEAQGLFRKFDVRRVDGSHAPGGKHHGCEYFVLDIDHDTHAPAAMRAYAEACKDSHPQLSAELTARFGTRPVQPAGAQEPVRLNDDDLTKIYMRFVGHQGLYPRLFEDIAGCVMAAMFEKLPSPAAAINEQLLEALKELMYARTDKAEGMADAAIAAAEAEKAKGGGDETVR